MNRHRSIRITALAAGATTALVLGVAVVPAGAASSTSGSSPNASAVHATRRSIAVRTEHAELIVRTKTGFKTIDLDRGKVTAVSSSSISVTRPDGVVVAATINSTTRFRGLPQSQVVVGDRALVTQSSGVAISVRSRTAATPSTNTSTSVAPAT
jgi:hypothetical protein